LIKFVASLYLARSPRVRHAESPAKDVIPAPNEKSYPIPLYNTGHQHYPNNKREAESAQSFEVGGEKPGVCNPTDLERSQDEHKPDQV
jgi:hypothetical protein